jgi:hypothetical protein
MEVEFSGNRGGRIVREWEPAKELLSLRPGPQREGVSCILNRVRDAQRDMVAIQVLFHVGTDIESTDQEFCFCGMRTGGDAPDGIDE